MTQPGKMKVRQSQQIHWQKRDSKFDDTAWKDEGKNISIITEYLRDTLATKRQQV